MYLPKNHLPNFFLNVDIGFRFSVVLTRLALPLYRRKAIENFSVLLPVSYLRFFVFIVSSKNNKEPRDIGDDNEKVKAELEAKSFSQIIEQFFG